MEDISQSTQTKLPQLPPKLIHGGIAARVFAEKISESPLGVFDAGNNTYRLIAAALQPLVVDDAAWQALAKDARLVFAAMQKTINHLRQPSQAPVAAAIFGDLSPIEKSAALDASTDTGGLCTIRFDLFFDGQDFKIIEVNTTIPAMQAYSDMIKWAYVQGWMAKQSDLAEASLASNKMQSNSLDLLNSLVQHYQAAGGTVTKPRIGIVARPGDSQIAELLWLKRVWEEQGYECLLTQPDKLTIHGENLQAEDVPLDVVYRHIFAYRLASGSDFAVALANSRRYRIFNPIAAHFEVKALLAEVSRLATNEEQSALLGLSQDETRAIAARIPWSRIVAPGPAVGPNSDHLADLIPWIKKHRSRLVLKSSAGYGGHQVFIGSEYAHDGSALRARQIVGATTDVSWEQLVDHCAAASQDKLWIVQEKVQGLKNNITYFKDGQADTKDAYIDCSLFANSGIDYFPSGAVSRFAFDPIVNIGRGGGLVPVLMRSEVESLMKHKQPSK